MVPSLEVKIKFMESKKWFVLTFIRHLYLSQQYISVGNNENKNNTYHSFYFFLPPLLV